MLRLELANESWDDEKQEFIYSNKRVLQLEHSLLSISKWEAKWHKPFLSKVDKTLDETVDYIRCMSMTGDIDDNTLSMLRNADVAKINAYIENPMTATTFPPEKRSGPNETITSELIYYWMVSYNIPFECQKWHINRLLTLIRVCNFKNTPPKKMSQKELLNKYSAINDARRKQLGTRG